MEELEEIEEIKKLIKEFDKITNEGTYNFIDLKDYKIRTDKTKRYWGL